MTPEILPEDFSDKPGSDPHGWVQLAREIEAGNGLEGLLDFMHRHGTADAQNRVYVPSGFEIERRARRRACSTRNNLAPKTCP